MKQWKMYKFDDEAHARTYQIYFEEHGEKWFFDSCYYYNEAAAMIELLSDSEVRAAVTEYLDSVPTMEDLFGPHKKAFKIVSPILDRVCSNHNFNWWAGFKVNIDTIKNALALERKAK